MTDQLDARDLTSGVRVVDELRPELVTQLARKGTAELRRTLGALFPHDLQMRTMPLSSDSVILRNLGKDEVLDEIAVDYTHQRKHGETSGSYSSFFATHDPDDRSLRIWGVSWSGPYVQEQIKEETGLRGGIRYAYNDISLQEVARVDTQSQQVTSSLGKASFKLSHPSVGDMVKTPEFRTLYFLEPTGGENE